MAASESHPSAHPGEAGSSVPESEAGEERVRGTRGGAQEVILARKDFLALLARTSEAVVGLVGTAKASLTCPVPVAALGRSQKASGKQKDYRDTGLLKRTFKLRVATWAAVIRRDDHVRALRVTPHFLDLKFKREWRRLRLRSQASFGDEPQALVGQTLREGGAMPPKDETERMLLMWATEFGLVGDRVERVPASTPAAEAMPPARLSPPVLGGPRPPSPAVSLQAAQGAPRANKRGRDAHDHTSAAAASATSSPDDASAGDIDNRSKRVLSPDAVARPRVAARATASCAPVKACSSRGVAVIEMVDSLAAAPSSSLVAVWEYAQAGGAPAELVEAAAAMARAHLADHGNKDRELAWATVARPDPRVALFTIDHIGGTREDAASVVISMLKRSQLLLPAVFAANIAGTPAAVAAAGTA